MVRRVIALEGDAVLDREHRWVLVPRGHCWVEGDSPTAATADSNTYGPVRLGVPRGGF